MVTAPEIEEYLQRSRKYWKQSQEHWTGGEKEKATELAWGSVAEAIKALAATGGRKLRTHRELRDFVRTVAQTHADPELYALFTESEAAHSNFYEGFMDEVAVREVLDKLGRLLFKVGELLPA